MTTLLQQLAYQYESEKAAAAGDFLMDPNSSPASLQQQWRQQQGQERGESITSSRDRDHAAQQRENKLQLQNHERDQHLHQLQSINNLLLDLPAPGSNKFPHDVASPTKAGSASLEDMSVSDLFGLAMPRGSLIGAGQKEQGGQAGFDTSANRNYYQQRENSSGYSSNLEHDNMSSYYSSLSSTDVPSSPISVHTPVSPSTPGSNSVYSSPYSSVSSSSPYASDSSPSNSYNKRFPSSPVRSPCYGRPIRGSPPYSDCSSPSVEYPPQVFGCNASRSNSPADSENSTNSIEGPLSDIMGCLSLHSSHNRCYPPPYPNIFLEAEKFIQNNRAPMDHPKLKKLLYGSNHLQQQQQPPQMPVYHHHHRHGHTRNHHLNPPHNGPHANHVLVPDKVCCLNSPRTLAVSTLPDNGSTNHLSLDKAAKYHRNAAAAADATYTWSGILPLRTQKPVGYSSKVFLGGVPWDITETILINTFRQFGPIRIEWPGKNEDANQPKGYVYIIFESEKQVKSLLCSCTHDYSNGVSYYYKISSRRMKGKQVQVIPWALNDSNFVRSSSQKLDPEKTVFVGALHGMLTALGLATIMNDLFDNVIYAGIDTDKHKYPIGSARVTFSSKHSFHKAINAAFIEIKTVKFTKKVQVDPYIEDAPCSSCFVQQGPYFCRESVCFKYYCHTCWQWVHSNNSMNWHEPMSRGLKSNQVIGLSPSVGAGRSLKQLL